MFATAIQSEMVSCASVDRACIRARHKRLSQIQEADPIISDIAGSKKGTFNFPTPNHAHLGHDLSPCPLGQSQPNIYMLFSEAAACTMKWA